MATGTATTTSVVESFARPNESVNRPTKCFDTREVGVVQLGTGSFDVTVTVMPHSSFNQTTRLTLRQRSIRPTVPAVRGGTLVDSVVFQLDAQSSCDGAAIGTLPNLVNMGIIYNVTVAVDKSKLQIVRWKAAPGRTWTPSRIRSRATRTSRPRSTWPGTYALIQKP